MKKKKSSWLLFYFQTSEAPKAAQAKSSEEPNTQIRYICLNIIYRVVKPVFHCVLVKKNKTEAKSGVDIGSALSVRKAFSIR